MTAEGTALHSNNVLPIDTGLTACTHINATAQLSKDKGVEKFIIVGAGVGGWIMLHAAQKKPDTVIGLVGVAADPDFTETLVWPALDETTKAKVMAEGIAEISWGECAYAKASERVREREPGGLRGRGVGAVRYRHASSSQCETLSAIVW
jgi:pimeloyl-ACP methyl ester carboxylesterase